MSTEGCVFNHMRDIDCNWEYKKHASYSGVCVCVCFQDNLARRVSKLRCLVFVKCCCQKLKHLF